MYDDRFTFQNLLIFLLYFVLGSSPVAPCTGFVFCIVLPCSLYCTSHATQTRIVYLRVLSFKIGIDNDCSIRVFHRLS